MITIKLQRHADHHAHAVPVLIKILFKRKQIQIRNVFANLLNFDKFRLDGEKIEP